MTQQQPDNSQRVAADPHVHMDALRLWLAGGIHKFAVDPRRRLGSHGRARQVLTEGRPYPPASSGPWGSLASTLERHTVLGGMTELSPEERQVITLAYLEGLTNREIAAEQGVSVSTVRRNLERALTQLDAYLTRTGSLLSALLVFVAGYSVAAATKVGRSGSVVGSADWTNKLASTAAIGAVAAAAIGVTAITPDSARPHSWSSPATIQVGAGSPRLRASQPMARAAAPSSQKSGLAPAPRPVAVAVSRSTGVTQGLNANGRQAEGSGQANRGCDGNNQNNVPPAVPTGSQKHHPHRRPTSHPPAGGCQG